MNDSNPHENIKSGNRYGAGWEELEPGVYVWSYSEWRAWRVEHVPPVFKLTVATLLGVTGWALFDAVTHNLGAGYCFGALAALVLVESVSKRLWKRCVR